MAEPRKIDLAGLRTTDERGWSLNPFLASGLAPSQIGGMHVVSVKPGTARGNHVHRGATEWLLIFGGPATLIWRSPTEPKPKELHLDQGGPWLFEIPPLVEHAIVNRSNSDFYLVAFYDQPDPATERCPRLTSETTS